LSATAVGPVDFSLHTLGWKAFEDLCVIVAKEVLGQTVTIFAGTSDRGRDAAFVGTWSRENKESFSGSFAIQCKHTSKDGATLNSNSLEKELAKASELAVNGLCDHYILMTNSSCTAAVEANLAKKFKAVGVQHFTILQKRWICLTIAESPRLRRLVPRIYGLGDLSTIIDERAYRQAKELLSAYKDDLAKFVPTSAYRSAAKALVDHGFVTILGEPASGKSTIARILSVSAADEWGVDCLDGDDPAEIKTHWNPDDPRQLFLFDDCFGSNTFEGPLAHKWNKAFPRFEAALRQGVKFVFTSRDYIYLRAAHDLKPEVRTRFMDSNIMIRVSETTPEEKAMILYNHLRGGDQPKSFKHTVKSFLPRVISERHLLPEVARRFGLKTFTTRLSHDQDGVTRFFKEPQRFLRETMESLAPSEKAALALVFIEGGRLSSPVQESERTDKYLSFFGVNLAQVRGVLESLKGSFLVHGLEKEEYVWRFRHPTMRDAFAELMADSPERMDVYLEGVPVRTMVDEISCGDAGVSNAKLIIPPSRYEKVLDKLQQEKLSYWRISGFLSSRCEPKFLRAYVDSEGFDYITNNLTDLSQFSQEAQQVEILMGSGNLRDDESQKIVAKVKYLAIENLDHRFSEGCYRKLLSDEQYHELCQDLLVAFREGNELHFESLTESLDIDTDAQEHFREFTGTISFLRSVFDLDEDDERLLNTLEWQINDEIESAEERQKARDRTPDDDFDERDVEIEGGVSRDMFDDVDE